ncbi:MAG TPA: DUF1549 and DUF1553 domain-containing protein [Gemmataceae bacterium]|jgi:hypothetical protein|nr:DUF1549 and DUF1553 domain-containing protein [Gemmataceae bacterium]
MLTLPRLVALISIVVVCAPLAADEQPRPEDHPAFRPIVRPKIPDVRGACSTNVDRFILAALEAKQLTFNTEADRPTLIRRVAFDLTGLPPTPAEIDAFTADRSPNAYEKMLEYYLASPRYGERWGKHWLDAAGYAESNGYFSADSDRPLAWRYRDYVIKSFNADKPFDWFVREQIAGDELVHFKPGSDVTPSMVDAITATHFLRNAPDGTGESDGNPDEVRTDRFSVLEGNVQNIVNCLLGLTIQCARCHDHKFEPITQAEYYGLQAILFPVYNPERWTKPNDRVVAIGTAAEVAAWKRRNDLIDRQVKAAQAGLASFADPLREQLLGERLPTVDAATRDAVIEASKAPKEKQTPAQQALLKTHAKAVKISDDDLAKRFPEYAALRDRVKQTVTEREKDRPPSIDKIATFTETDPSPPAHHVLKRGQHGQPGAEVQPGVPASLSTTHNNYHVDPRPAGQITTGRRTAFANWLTSTANPLTVRVMANRIWQHHFGTGIVATADNLGVSGAKPSHAELLDYLAAEFVRSEWSIKELHRLIMASAVYRQASAPRPELEKIDPDNRLLARFPSRRLDAEAIRDAMLAISGDLDPQAGGPFVASKRTPEGVVEVAENDAGARRRSVYLQQRRTQVVTFLQLFDAPAIVSTCGKRSPSTVPLQSLALLNSEFARARARSFAQRLAREAGSDTNARINLAFTLVGGRPLAMDERVACESFLSAQRSVYAKEKDGDERAWADLCQMLLASNRFLYVE